MGLVLLAGCSSSDADAKKPEETEDLTEEETVESQTIYTEQITPEGGLGDTLKVVDDIYENNDTDEWLDDYNEVVKAIENGDDIDDELQFKMYSGKFDDDRFMAFANDHFLIEAFSLFITKNEGHQVSGEEAIAIAEKHMPTDAKKVDEYESEEAPGVKYIITYESKMIDKRFEDADGTFYVELTGSIEFNEYSAVSFFLE